MPDGDKPDMVRLAKAVRNKAVALKHYARGPEHLYERAARKVVDAKSDAQATHFPTQTGADGKRQERTVPTEVLAGQASGPILSAPVASCPDVLMTLWGFEPQS